MHPVEAAYQELCWYTLGHGAPEFLHQHVVDAFTAQRATAGTKPIALACALVGLYLHVDRGFTGRAVQRAHMSLANGARDWPAFTVPASRGAMTAADVLAHPEGPERDAAIHAWAAAVWETWRANEPAVLALLRRARLVP